MTKITKIAAIAALLTASASASAFWGGPGMGSWGDDFFGDGWGDFNMSMNTHASGSGRGYGYNRYAPYGYAPYGYPHYGAYGNPYATPYAAPYAAAPMAPQVPVAPSK